MPGSIFKNSFFSTVLRIQVFLIAGFFVACGTIPVPSISTSGSTSPQKLNSDMSFNNDIKGASEGYKSDMHYIQSDIHTLAKTELSSKSNSNYESSIVMPENINLENKASFTAKSVISVKQDTDTHSQIMNMNHSINSPEAMTARNYFEAGEYKQAIDLYEILSRENSDIQEYSDMLLKCYSEFAADLIKKADFSAAKKILHEAMILYPGDSNLIVNIDELELRLEADKQYSDGVEALNNELAEKAIVYFTKALYIYPLHNQAKLQLNMLKDKYLSTYYKEAMVHFRKQELDQAISKWGRVLLLEPGHQMAKAYLARATALKSRFDKL